PHIKDPFGSINLVMGDEIASLVCNFISLFSLHVPVVVLKYLEPVMACWAPKAEVTRKACLPPDVEHSAGRGAKLFILWSVGIISGGALVSWFKQNICCVRKVANHT
ncbi:unnamed protein product, partial [Hapterophycus canaliculatus]